MSVLQVVAPAYASGQQEGCGRNNTAQQQPPQGCNKEERGWSPTVVDACVMMMVEMTGGRQSLPNVAPPPAWSRAT
jgi:hypothetical protein